MEQRFSALILASSKPRERVDSAVLAYTSRRHGLLYFSGSMDRMFMHMASDPAMVIIFHSLNFVLQPGVIRVESLHGGLLPVKIQAHRKLCFCSISSFCMYLEEFIKGGRIWPVRYVCSRCRKVPKWSNSI